MHEMFLMFVIRCQALYDGVMDKIRKRCSFVNEFRELSISIALFSLTTSTRLSFTPSIPTLLTDHINHSIPIILDQLPPLTPPTTLVTQILKHCVHLPYLLNEPDNLKLLPESLLDLFKGPLPLLARCVVPEAAELAAGGRPAGASLGEAAAIYFYEGG